MRLIDADELYALIDDGYDLDFDEVPETKAELLRMIAEQPVIEERKHGKWVRNDNGTYSCSVCQSWVPEEQHYYARYCLYCGADMRGE